MASLKLDSFGLVLDGTPLLEEIGFVLEAEQAIGLIGPRGAGKSILALAISGLQPARARTTGSIAVDGAPLPADEAGRAKVRSKQIVTLIQNAGDALDPLRTAADQLRLAIGDNAASADRLLGEVGLEAADGARYPSELSAQQRQCLGLALALAREPELLIADEPTTGLDFAAQRRLLDLIGRHQKERGMGLLLVSRDVRAVAMLCARVMVMAGGRIIESGIKEVVFGYPKQEISRRALSSGRQRARTLMRTPIGGLLLEANAATRRVRPKAGGWRPPTLILDKVTFSMRAGESVAVLGASGAGKTTLGRAIAGLDRLSAGTLSFDGHLYRGSDISETVRRDIGMVFAEPRLSFDPRRTVGESIAEPLRLEDQRQLDDSSARLVEIVTAMGLTTSVFNRHPGDFTDGELMRFAIVRALVTRPRLVILDEPLAALDITERAEMMVLLNRLRADFGLTLLVLSRDVETVRMLADRVVLLDKGQVIETGLLAQLIEGAQSPVTRALLAADLPALGIVPVF
ncbi:MAG: ATP-binding cassette domain-containing protein [Devosia sp.]